MYEAPAKNPPDPARCFRPERYDTIVDLVGYGGQYTVLHCFAFCSHVLFCCVRVVCVQECRDASFQVNFTGFRGKFEDALWYISRFNGNELTRDREMWPYFIHPDGSITGRWDSTNFPTGNYHGEEFERKYGVAV